MSIFYDEAMSLIDAECSRLDAECAEIDSDTAKEKELKNKYNLLKCRWGSITSFTAPFYNSHRLFANNSEAHYMTPHIWADLCADETLFNTFNTLYNDADEDLRRDIALLFGWHAYAYRMMREKAQKFASADDSERLKVSEYLSGYRFALDSIRQAWKDTIGLDIRWTSPYSAVEIESALISAAETMRNDCNVRIAELSADAKNEKKALSIEKGMYDFCLNGGLLAYSSHDRINVIRKKAERMPNFIGGYPQLAKAFDEADYDEKLRLTAAFYSIVWMGDQPMPQYRREYALAKEHDDVRKIFELQIQINTVSAVIAKWRELADIFGYAGLVEV